MANSDAWCNAHKSCTSWFSVDPQCCCPLLYLIRNLHWVFKVGDRTATVRFYTDVLLMEPLRHEEVRAHGCRGSGARSGASAGLQPRVF